MPEISIIVPVYNVEKYLDKCVNSILGQTFQDFELILVDDGSPDNCGKICDRYADIDKRLTVIHQENGGLSAARNAGIEVAKSRYIGFVDSDDYIAKDMYEVLYRNILKEKADLSVCGIYDVYENREPIIKDPQYLILDKVKMIKLILEAKIVSVHAVNKLYKKELFENVRYPEGMITEDAAIILSLLEKTEKVVVDTRQKYYYYHRENSISSMKFSEKDLDTINVWEKNEIYILSNYPELSYQVHTRVCWSYFTVLDKMMNSQNVEEYRKDKNKIICYLRKNFTFIMKNQYFRVPRKIAAIMLKIYPFLYKLFSRLENEMVKKKNK